MFHHNCLLTIVHGKVCTKEKWACTSKWKVVRGVTRHWYLLACFIYLKILAWTAKNQTEIISIYTAKFSEFCSLKKSKQELLYFPWPCLTIQNRKMTMWSALNEWVVLTTSPLSFPLSWFDLLVIRLVQLCYLWSFGGLLAINYNFPSFFPLIFSQ